ncbi:arsenate reductase family protein [Paenalkalicoccus suaedae]|uniref:Arsenate reductase family protein n=1 Tax=Paenalkalicoccus suaedae TaxID=2592382 RepID=A0A859FHB0_9BACI|nr:arsenate reductase family protein [Paenalkalicoccus suaedae]QKS72218.1 arsenate reductase family protein [Paenalkalicoccus suaedae]
MTVTFYQYPACSTCKKAEKWLKDNDVSYESVHIVEDTPSKETLRELVSKSDQPIKKFFNTSGKKYRELGLKDKVQSADEDELLEILASDGMLIKRPLATDGKNVTIGFKEDIYEEMWK